MVSEFWSGWFDHWGEEHHLDADGGTSIQRSLDALDEILSAGASINFYMFHGGTNFGFMNGANGYPTLYQANVTSYDYASPIGEDGDLSPRYESYREVLKKYADLPSIAHLQPGKKCAFGSVELKESTGLFESLAALSQPRTSVVTKTMEDLDQDYGFILYRTRVSGPRMGVLRVIGLHDRAQLFLDGDLLEVLDRESGNEYTAIDIARDAQLDILVENMGRVNFGPSLMDRKGITGGVTVNDQFQFGWEIFPLPLNDLSRLKFGLSQPESFPAFFRAHFNVDDPADTFLALPGWTKGVAWVNGFNLGRYWERGPQKTLYVPAPALKRGENELIVLELHGTSSLLVDFQDKPILG
jgi:beta-galactosidase